MEQVQSTFGNLVNDQVTAGELTPPTTRALRLSNLLVLATVAVALLLGLALRAAVESRTSQYADTLVRFKYPARWIVAQDEDGNPAVRNPNSASKLFNDRVVVTHTAVPSSGLPGGSPLAEAATAWTLSRSASLDTFRNLATTDGLTVAGQPAIRMDYVYVADPAANLGRPGVPIVVRGSDYVLITGDQLTVLTGQANSASWDEFEPSFTRIMNSASTAQ